MDYDRIRDFIISYSHDDEGYLGEIHDKAVSEDVPIIRRDAADFIKFLLYIIRPERILEIGTAVGYSAIFMATYSDRAYIDTCELDEVRAGEAEANIKKAGMDDRISIHIGDAIQTIREFEDRTYDLVFIDAAKARYMDYLNEAMRFLHKGSVIISDNIFADGDVLESHFLVEKRDRTIHDRMREYIYNIKNDERFETAILSVADGMAVSVVK